MLLSHWSWEFPIASFTTRGYYAARLNLESTLNYLAQSPVILPQKSNPAQITSLCFEHVLSKLQADVAFPLKLGISYCQLDNQGVITANASSARLYIASLCFWHVLSKLQGRLPFLMRKSGRSRKKCSAKIQGFTIVIFHIHMALSWGRVSLAAPAVLGVNVLDRHIGYRHTRGLCETRNTQHGSKLGAQLYTILWVLLGSCLAVRQQNLTPSYKLVYNHH